MTRLGELLRSSPLTEALRRLFLRGPACSFVHTLLVTRLYVRHNHSMTKTHLHSQLHLRALATKSSSSMVSCEIAHVFVLIRERILYNVILLIFRCNDDNDASLHVPAFAYECYFTVMSRKEAKTCVESSNASPWCALDRSLSCASTLTLIDLELGCNFACGC